MKFPLRWIMKYHLWYKGQHSTVFTSFLLSFLFYFLSNTWVEFRNTAKKRPLYSHVWLYKVHKFDFGKTVFQKWDISKWHKVIWFNGNIAKILERTWTFFIILENV